MLDKALIQRLITKIRRSTEFDINVMNEKGIIVTSTNEQRIGRFHEVAYDMLQSGTDIQIVEESDKYLGTKPGVNMTIIVNGEKQGIVGVSGNPEEVCPIIHIVKMSLESMIEYELNLRQIYQKKSKDRIFFETLLYGSEVKDTEIEAMANELQYNTHEVRIPIILEFSSEIDKDKLIHRIQNLYCFQSQNILALSRSGKIVLFKVLEQKEWMYFKRNIENWLKEFEDELGFCIDKAGIGMPKNKLCEYKDSYEYARFAFDIDKSMKIRYFSDLLSCYIKAQLPENCIYKIFSIYDEFYNPSKYDFWIETLATFEDCNYNINESAKKLHIHRNTMIFRINKIKILLDLDPINKRSDAVFLEYLIQYYRIYSKIREV